MAMPNKERESNPLSDFRSHQQSSLRSKLTAIAVFAWLMVAPVMIGVLGGHWLDRIVGKDFMYAYALAIAGFGFGCFLIWLELRRGSGREAGDPEHSKDPRDFQVPMESGP